MNNHQRFRRRSALHFALAIGLAALMASASTDAAMSVRRTIDRVQPQVVKIYGASGIRGLEPYQTGILVSETGHVVTAWSAVLDTEYLLVTLNDGRKFEAAMLDLNPRLEIAVLKIEATGLPHFRLETSVDPTAGQSVLAFGNLYGVATGNESVTALHGRISAITNLSGRRGSFKTPYQGPVFVLDAMTNNPGAAGGALTDFRGELIGLLGKELRNAENHVWLNYAIPISQWKTAVEDILSGKAVATDDTVSPRGAADPWNLERLGLRLVADLLPRTPAFVDALVANSPADVAGIQADDLIVYLDDQLIQSCRQVKELLTHIDRFQPITITVLRDNEQLHVLQCRP